MVTYDFYKNTYLGSALAETVFPRAAARAEAWLNKVERTCRVTQDGPDSRCLALCALAEAMEAQERRRNIASTTVGGVSVRYEGGKDNSRQLLEAAGTYLTIRRGVC